MKMFKKISAIVLVVAMMLTMVSFTAFAATIDGLDVKVTDIDGNEIDSILAGKTVYVRVYLAEQTYGGASIDLIFPESYSIDRSLVTHAGANTVGGQTANRVTVSWTSTFTVTSNPIVTIPVTIPIDQTEGLLDLVDVTKCAVNDTEGNTIKNTDASATTITVEAAWAITGQEALAKTVELGATIDEAKTVLGNTITVTGADSKSGTRNVENWTSADYNGNALGTYNFTGILVANENAPSYGEWIPTATVEVVKREVTITQGIDNVVKKQAQAGLTADDLEAALKTSFELSEGTAFAETVTVDWNAVSSDPDPITGAKGNKVVFEGTVQGTPANHKVTVAQVTVELDNLLDEDEVVAMVGADQYASLQEAVNAAAGADIKLDVNSENVTDAVTVAADTVIDLNGKTYGGAIDVTSGTLTLKNEGKIAGGVTGNVAAAAGYQLVTMNDGALAVVSDAAATDVKVKLVQVLDEAGEKVPGEFDIILEGVDGKDINEFVSAELVFTNRSKTISGAPMLYSIAGADAYAKEDGTRIGTDPDAKITAVRDLSEVNDKDPDNLVQRWGFAIVEMENHESNAPAETVKLGTMKFDGYGQIDLEVTDGVVHTTIEDTNIEYQYYVDGNALKTDADGDLTLGAESKINGDAGKVEPVKRWVKINVEFPNDLVFATADDTDYNDMYVSVTGEYPDFRPETKALDIKTNVLGIYEVEVYAGYRYTFTIEGAGYRTTRYTTIVGEVDKVEVDGEMVMPALELTFWNNVKYKDSAIDPWKEIEVGVSNPYKWNFLAGDIVMDNIIDKYDLAAVVSYFGTYDLSATNKDTYVKYDLNRDGKINSEDIAYVLYSIGE